VSHTDGRIVLEEKGGREEKNKRKDSDETKNCKAIEKRRKEGRKEKSKKSEDEVFLNARDLVSKKRELKLSLQKKRCRRCCCWWPHATKGQEEGTKKQKEDKMMKKGRQRARTFSFLFPIFSSHGVRTPDSVAMILFYCILFIFCGDFSPFCEKQFQKRIVCRKFPGFLN
jgi:hypothetical protein